MSSRLVRLALTTALTISSLGASLFAADTIPADRRLPPDVLAFVRVANVTEFKDQMGKSTYGKVWEDPAMGDFRKNVEEEVAKYISEKSEQIGFPVGDLMSLPQGEVAFALVQPGGETLGMVAFLDVGSDRSTLDKALDLLEKQLKADDAKRTTEDMDGTEVVIHELMSTDDEESEPGEEAEAKRLIYLVKDGMLVVCSHLETVEEVLDRWDGKHRDVFADDENYKLTIERCSEGQADPAMSWYLNPIETVQAGMSMNPQAATSAMMMQAYLAPLGLDGLKGMGGAMDMGADGYGAKSRTYIRAEQPVSGVLKIFSMPVANQAPPAWVPADVAGFSSLNWDAQGAYSAIEKAVDSVLSQPGGFKKQMDGLAKRKPNIHPKTDVIDQLSGSVRVLSGAPEGTELEQTTLVAIEIKSEQAMTDVLTKVTAEAQIGKREFEGVTIFEPKNAPPNMAAAAFAVARGHLWFTNKVSELENVLRTPKADSPLSESPEYKSIAGMVPESTSMLAYGRPDVQYKGAYEAARSGKFDGFTEGRIDFSKLPDFDSIRKYLRPSGFYIIPDDNGVLMENVEAAGK